MMSVPNHVFDDPDLFDVEDVDSEPSTPEPIEITCKRCRGTCEDRHGNDCLACEGLGSILL